MRHNDLRGRYAAQFRVEEGMLVYRHRRRGAPVEVSEAERDRAIERFVAAARMVKWTALATLLAGVMALTIALPAAFNSPWWIMGAVGASAIFASGAMRWAWNMPTQRWREREPVGEPLGQAGALIMLTEQVTWLQVAAGIIVPLAVAPLLAKIAAVDLFAWPPRSPQQLALMLLIGAMFASGLLFATLKWALHERARLRERGRTAIEEARRVGDGVE